MEPSPPLQQAGIGVVVPYDFALDRELWRWLPNDASLHLTRMPYAPMPATMEMAVHISDPELVAQARGFFGQEGKHASAHDDYNDMLRAQGYQIDRFLAAYAWWGREVTERIMPPELRLATTAAAEHFTAIMAENAFKKQILAAAHPTMKSLLQWHAAEEIEHKSVAFDVLQRVNPSYALRLAGMVVATVQLSSWWMLGTLTLLRQERLSLAELRAERDGIRATRPDDEGIARRVFLRGIREYLRRDFHPADNDNFHLAELLLRDSGVVAASA